MLYISLITIFLSFLLIVAPYIYDESLSIISHPIAFVLLLVGALTFFLYIDDYIGETQDELDIMIETSVNEAKEQQVEKENKLIVFLQELVDEKAEYMYQESDSGLHVLRAGRDIYRIHFEDNEVKYVVQHDRIIYEE